jgi:DNA-binding transcriptional MerR regulator
MTSGQLAKHMGVSYFQLAHWGSLYGIRPFELPREYNKPRNYFYTEGQIAKLQFVHRLERQGLRNEEIAERLEGWRLEEVAA